MGKRGPKPSRPPCPTCGKSPICYQSPYYRCGCGRFRLVDGQLRPISATGRPKSEPQPKRVTARKERRGPVMQAQKPLEWWEVEALNGWTPVEVEL